MDEEEFPRKKKFYFGSPSNTPWNNDLFVKQSSKVEQKFNDPTIKEKNLAIWRAEQARNVCTPEYVHEEELETVRSTGSRTAKKIRKSRGLKNIVREELKDDIDSLRKQVGTAVMEAKKRNQKLDELVNLVKEISDEQKRW